MSISFSDFAPSGKIGAWTRFGVSDWPLPHPKDVRDFKRLRVYVYDLPDVYVAGVAQYLSALLAPKQLELQHLQRRREQAIAREPAAGISHCMVRRCVLRNVLNSSRAAAFGRLGLRQYTSEIPVLLRLLQVATLVARPEDAHAFLVPMPIGTWITSGFIRQRPGSLRGLYYNLSQHLPHLNQQTARRHVYLASQDSAFVRVPAPFATESIVFTLGDDEWNATRLRFRTFRRDAHFRRSIVLPFRSELPDLAEIRALHDPSHPSHRQDIAHRRPLLLYAALSVGRNAARRAMVDAIQNVSSAYGHALQRRIVLGEIGGGYDDVDRRARRARESTFCLAPAGDAPSFTQRFYFALIRGCIPVRVNPFTRHEATRHQHEEAGTSTGRGESEPRKPPGFAYPFPSLIDWNRGIVVEVNATTAGYRSILPRLVELEERAHLARRYLLEEAAHWLLFDGHNDETRHNGSRALPLQDAASAALYTLAEKLDVTES